MTSCDRHERVNVSRAASSQLVTFVLEADQSEQTRVKGMDRGL